MKILLSVNWNISECPLNAHGMFTEIRISGTVQWPFSGHSVPLNAAEWQAHFSDHSVFLFWIFRVKNSKLFHQIRGIKLILLWFTTHEIKKNKKKNYAHGHAGSNQGILVLVVPNPVRYLCATLLHIVSELILILKCIHF